MKLNLTPNGVDLLLHCLEGGPSPVFTAIVLGNGSDAGSEATAMSNALEEIPINTIERAEGADFVTLTGVLNNAQIENRFRATETGVYAQNPDDELGTILFAYACVPDDEAAVIPAAADYAFETIEKVSVYVGTTQDVTAIIAESTLTATRAELLQHTNDVHNPHLVTAEQVGLGNVPNVSTDGQTPTIELFDAPYNGRYDDGFKDTTEYDNEGNHVDDGLINLVPEPNDTMAEIMKKLSSLAKEMVKHLNNISNPHYVVARETGAASSSHKHSTNDITSGVLSVSRGGTGVSSMSALVSLLGTYFSVPVFGTYTGDGTIKRLISLSFTPKAVLIMDETGMPADDIKGTCGGLAVGGEGVTAYNSSGVYARTWNNSYTCLMITTNGFYVNYNSSNSIKVRTNTSGVSYRYIAFR